MKDTKEKTKILSLKTQSNLIRLAFYLVIVVLLNLASSTFFIRFDLTSKGVYSLSEASKKAVSTLAEPLTIKAFFSRNLPNQYSTLEQTIRDLLDEYKLFGKSKFNFEFITMGDSGQSSNTAGADGKGETNEQKAQSYSIYPVQIQSFEQDEVKLISSYMGLAFIHGSQIESIAALDPAENLEYKITSTIQKMNNKTSALLRIKEGEIQVKVFLSAHLRQLATLSTEIEKTVSDLNPKLAGRLKYALLNPDNDSAITADADKLNAFALQLEGDDGKPLPYKSYAGLVIELGDQSYPIPLITQIPLFGYTAVNAEQLKTSIEGIATKMIGAFQEIGYLSSNGTLSLYGDYGMSPTGQRNEGLSNFNKQIADIYTIKESNLAEGIPSGLKTFIIAKPKENFSEYDLFQIDQFLMQGNSLALFLDGLDEEMNPNYQGNYGNAATYKPLQTGLEKLLNHYGVNVKPAYVLDENCYINRQNAQTGALQETPLYFVPKISDKYINNNLDFIKNINQLFLLQTSPLELFQDKLGDKVKAHLLISSSDKSWEVSDNIDLYSPYGMTPPADSDSKKSRPLAYLLEGQFTSYFKDKPLPEKPQAEAAAADKDKPAAENVIKQTAVAKAENFIPQSKGGKIFVIGASTLLENRVLGSTAENPNAQFLLNVLDHLNDRDAFAVMRSKGEAVNPLRETSKFTQELIKNINLILPPLLSVIAGIIFWFIWENRKKKIQALFTKEQQ